MRHTSGTAFFRSFSDTLARAFGWHRANSSPAPAKAMTAQRNPRVMPVLSAPRAWLNELSWEKILVFNQSQCQLQNTQTLPNQKCYDAVRQRWDGVLNEPMSLVKALVLCKESHDKSPFVFSNSSTFCLVAKAMVEDLAKDLPAVEAHIVRSTAANYVSGSVSKRELIEILRVYESEWSKLARVSSNGHLETPANG
jgi:hypothetical protein